MCILGKALGNGFPITVILGKRNVMEAAQNSFISSTFWTERSGYVAGIRTLEIMEKLKSWKIITNQGLKLRNEIKRIGEKHKLKLEIFGLSPCPTFVIKSSNWIKYKTFITQELLEKKILGANSSYLSIHHNDKIIENYINHLDETFFKIYECEKQKLNIDDLLKTEMCHTGFERLN